ncbi:hypothetical protein ABK040_012701 [Willaertia magna]
MFVSKLQLTNVSQKNLIPLKDRDDNTFFIPEQLKNLNIPNNFLLLFGSVHASNDKSIVQLFEIDKVKKVVAGDTMCVVLMEDGKCFVNLNEKFFLFQDFQISGLVVDVFVHTYLILVTDKGELFIYIKDNKNLIFYKKALTEEFNNEKITDIACGFKYFIILTENNNIYGYGDNTKGQLGTKRDLEITKITKINTDYITSKIDKIYCSHSNTFLLTKDGKCYACGDPSYCCDGQLSLQFASKEVFKLIPNLDNEFIETVITGLFFVALKTKSGKYFVFGYNCYYLLSSSETVVNNRIAGPRLLDTFQNNKIEEFACGGYHSIIIDKNRDIFMSGENEKHSFYSYSKKYTNINLKSYFKNNDIFKADSKYKLNVIMGRYFTVIYSSKLNRKLNYKRSIKLSDIDIIVNDSNSCYEECCNFMDDQ